MTIPPIKQIVVGIDFSESSKSALFHATRLAKSQNADIHLLHVVDELVLRELQDVVQQPPEQVKDSVFNDAQRDMEEMLQTVDHGPDVHIDVRVGPILHEIIEKVKEVRANLLIVGATSDPAKRSAVGTLALKCVRKVPTMVMLVRPPHHDLFKTIVVCVDFSDISARLVHRAATIAINENAELHLLHVYAAPWDRLHYRAPTPQATVYFQTQFKRALQSRLESYLETLPDDVRSQLRVQCQLHEDPSYGYGIVDYANNCNADLVVLGTRGRTNLRYIFLGSTAERVVQKAPCSILAIKPLEYSIEGETANSDKGDNPS